MRDAVLLDIHGNFDALQAALAAVAEADCDGLILCGDDAYLGPAPDECVDRLRSFGGRVVAVRGNTGRMIANGYDAVAEWAADSFGDERVSWLGGLQPQRVFPEHHALLVHAVPGDDEWRLTPETRDGLAEVRVADVEHATLLCENVHVQYTRRVGGVEIVNPGSVGFPFDGNHAAAWAIVDDESVQLRRIPFDGEPALTRRTPFDGEPALTRLAAQPSRPERVRFRAPTLHGLRLSSSGMMSG